MVGVTTPARYKDVTWALRFEVLDQSFDLVVAELWCAGCDGVQEIEPLQSEAPAAGEARRLVAYFPAEPLPAVLAKVQSLGGRLVSRELLPARDWLAEYRRRAKPFALGRRWWIDPRDFESQVERESRQPDPGQSTTPSPSGRTLLRVPARRAFGTGSHPTTALLLLLLEELGEQTGQPQGRGLAPIRPFGKSLDRCAVLDVGCGSGILSAAAYSLGARHLVAFDEDPIAVLLARSTAALNRTPFSSFAGSVEALATGRSFDLMLINVLPEHLEGDERSLVQLLQPAGRILLSGILAEREAEIGALWQRHGMELIARRPREEWVALALGRDPQATRATRPEARQ